MRLQLHALPWLARRTGIKIGVLWETMLFTETTPRWSTIEVWHGLRMRCVTVFV